MLFVSFKRHEFLFCTVLFKFLQLPKSFLLILLFVFTWTLEVFYLLYVKFAFGRWLRVAHCVQLFVIVW